MTLQPRLWSGPSWAGAGWKMRNIPRGQQSEVRLSRSGSTGCYQELRVINAVSPAPHGRCGSGHRWDGKEGHPSSETTYDTEPQRCVIDPLPPSLRGHPSHRYTFPFLYRSRGAGGNPRMSIWTETDLAFVHRAH